MNRIGHERHKGGGQGLRFALSDWARQLRSHWTAILLLVAHLGLGTIYSVVVPIWEAYDEDGHYQYARYIATKRALPRRGDPEAEAISEKVQPPLYYLLAAASQRNMSYIKEVSSWEMEANR